MVLLMRYRVKNAVHMGEPTSNCGLSPFRFFTDLSLTTLLSKSQWVPSTSAVVKSRASPGISLSSGNNLVAAVTLGVSTHRIQLL